VGELPISSQQAQKLEVKPYTQLSPYLEMCCVRSSANVSYENASKDVEFFTGISVSSNTQQRLVHRQDLSAPQIETTVEELSVDGGKVRIRTPIGEESAWRDYKVVALHEIATEAWFQDNNALIEWVNTQPIASTLTCIGDGHDGIWNIIRELTPPEARREILDWYHLKENLYKIGGSLQVLHKAEALLWRGEVEPVLALLRDFEGKPAQNFAQYLTKHRHRIVNYEYYQAEQICSIGSGTVESAVKQIGDRIKISGAQWNQENVSQVLAQRCAYLNGMLTI
jgi:hypothetical protein